MSTQKKKTRGTKKEHLDPVKSLLSTDSEEKLLEAHEETPLLTAHEEEAAPKAAKIAAAAAATAAGATAAKAAHRHYEHHAPKKEPVASVPEADVVDDEPLEEYIAEKKSGIRSQVLAAIVIGAIILIGLACILGYLNDRSGEPYYTNAAYNTQQVVPDAQGVVAVPVAYHQGHYHLTAGTGDGSIHRDLPSAVSAATGGVSAPVVVYLFNFDSDGVPENPTLTTMAKAAKDSGKTIYIKAYTDEKGSPAYNQKLSQRRANAIGSYMKQHGVPANHVQATGYGPTHKYPTDLQNRRAELTMQ